MEAIKSITSVEIAINTLMTNVNNEYVVAIGIVAIFTVPFIYDFLNRLRDQMIEHSYDLKIKIGDATIDFVKSENGSPPQTSC